MATPASTAHGTTVKISPSIMCADFLNLQHELSLFEEEGLHSIHVDIMDGHYVPNLTLGPGFAKSIAAGCSLPLDLHLMVDRAEAYLPAFAHAIQAGENEHPSAADGLDVKEERDVIVSFHPETAWHPARTIEQIRAQGMRPAIALSPAVSVERFSMLLHDVELVVVMTVNPGYSGQKLIPWTLDKVRELVRLRREKGYRYEIEIDGNVSWDNIPGMIEAGGDVLVAGTSSMFGQLNQRRRDIRRLKSLVAAS